MSGPDPQPQNRRGRWVAILTGAISVLIGVAYLLLITLLINLLARWLVRRVATGLPGGRSS